MVHLCAFQPRLAHVLLTAIELSPLHGHAVSGTVTMACGPATGRTLGSNTASSGQGRWASSKWDPNPADGPQGASAGERLRAAAAALARLPEPALARPLGVCAEAGALVTALPPVRCGHCTRLSRQ